MSTLDDLRQQWTPRERLAHALAMAKAGIETTERGILRGRKGAPDENQRHRAEYQRVLGEFEKLQETPCEL